MDKKNLDSLDPQLKATYDRIMAVPTAPQSQTPVQASVPAPQPSVTLNPQQPAAIPQVPPQQPLPIQNAAPVAPTQQAISTSHQNAGLSATGSPLPTPPKKSHRVLIFSSIIFGLAILGLYTVFWLNFFNIPIGY